MHCAWMLCLVPYFPIICIPFIVVVTQCLVLRAFMSVYGVYVTLWAVLMFLWRLPEGHIVPVNIEHYNAALDIETLFYKLSFAFLSSFNLYLK